MKSEDSVVYTLQIVSIYRRELTLSFTSELLLPYQLHLLCSFRHLDWSEAELRDLRTVKE
ncbi:hypothetical protein [Sphingobacterium faecale]|uniref:Uncharacterized protein n=1 Tax=Sphingobacterium faecale TaxID=2803775 RepID=A0ABS1RBC2_9SPHI|nr:hypothetical protein [Sphingobacterium faecale]MBL1411307.1 hypothetical protein [Sphingobacterium faecale]